MRTVIYHRVEAVVVSKRQSGGPVDRSNHRSMVKSEQGQDSNTTALFELFDLLVVVRRVAEDDRYGHF
jgi:hypothetical protein